MTYKKVLPGFDATYYAELSESDWLEASVSKEKDPENPWYEIWTFPALGVKRAHRKDDGEYLHLEIEVRDSNGSLISSERAPSIKYISESRLLKSTRIPPGF